MVLTQVEPDWLQAVQTSEPRISAPGWPTRVSGLLIGHRFTEDAGRHGHRRASRRGVHPGLDRRPAAAGRGVGVGVGGGGRTSAAPGSTELGGRYTRAVMLSGVNPRTRATNRAPFETNVVNRRSVDIVRCRSWSPAGFRLAMSTGAAALGLCPAAGPTRPNTKTDRRCRPRLHSTCKKLGPCHHHRSPAETRDSVVATPHRRRSATESPYRATGRSRPGTPPRFRGYDVTT